MMPLALFASPTFIGCTVLTLLLYGALGAVTVLIPYLLIEARGYSGIQAGSALLPLAIILAVMSPLMGRLAGRIGPRLPLSIGSLVVAAGFLLMLRIGPDASYWRDVFPAIVVMSFGMAGAVAPLTTAVLSSVEEKYRRRIRTQQRRRAHRRPDGDRAARFGTGTGDRTPGCVSRRNVRLRARLCRVLGERLLPAAGRRGARPACGDKPGNLTRHFSAAGCPCCHDGCSR